MFSKRRGKRTLGKMLASWQALVIFLFIALSLGCLWAITSYLPSNQSFTYLNQANAMAVQDKVIKQQVLSAVSVLDGLNAKVKAGQMSMTAAKKLGADLLREMRYGTNKDGYFFADTTAGVNIVLLGDKKTEGRNRLEDNVKGIYYVKDLLAAGQQADGGFVNYWYPKKDSDTPVQKRSYALEYKPFGWVIGTGYYLEDLK